MDASHMNTDVFTGCSIRGLPIGKPFKTKILVSKGKGMEKENVYGVFIISTFRNEHASDVVEVVEVTPDHTDGVTELKALASTENGRTIECRCRLHLGTQDTSVQTDSGEIEVPHNETTNVVHGEIEVPRNETTHNETTRNETTDVVHGETEVSHNETTDVVHVKTEEDSTEQPQSMSNTKCLISSNDNESNETETVSLKTEVVEEITSEVKERLTRRKSARLRSGFISKYGCTEGDQCPGVKGVVEVDPGYPDGKQPEGMQWAGAGDDGKQPEGTQWARAGDDGKQPEGTQWARAGDDGKQPEGMQWARAGDDGKQPVGMQGAGAGDDGKQPEGTQGAGAGDDGKQPEGMQGAGAGDDGKQPEGMQGAGAGHDEKTEYMDTCQSDSDMDYIQYKSKRKKNDDNNPNFDPDCKSNLSDNTDKEIMHDEIQDGPSNIENVKKKHSNKQRNTSTSDSEFTDTLFDDDEDIDDQNKKKRRKKKKILNSEKQAGQIKTVKKKLCNRRRRKSTVDSDFTDMSVEDDEDEDVDVKINKRKKKRKTSNDSESGLDDDDFDPELAKLSPKGRQAEKMKREKQKEKLQKEAQKIKVKLQDHPDKYRVEMLESFARKDRGKAPEESAVRLMVCAICEKFKTENAEIMEIHIECHLNGEMHCTECDFIAAFVGELKQHKRLIHKRNVQICSECGEETSGLEGLMDHMGKVHDKPQWKCNHCLIERNIQFASVTKRLSRIHTRREHPDKLIHCDSCNRMYSTENQLKRHHETNCHGKEPNVHPCEKCGKTYVGQDRLKLHIERVHSNIKRFQCPHCPFAACRRPSLTMHLNVHNGYHPFKCDQCTFTCVQKSQLTSHMRTHTGDKPYKCDQCQYAAAWKVQLKDHLKIHAMPNTITCNQCHILFKDLRAFKMHVGKEHSPNVD